MDNKEDYETLTLNDNYDTEKMSILEKIKFVFKR